MTGATGTEKAARQVAWACMRLHRSSFTYDELRDGYVKLDEGEPLDWTAVFADFTARGYLRRDGALYSLTAAGHAHADTLRGEDFGESLVRTDDSTVYDTFCERLYGKDLGQFSMTTMEQLEQLMAVLHLDAQSRVLDLGCSVGRMTEYISDVTGAHLTGLDFAGPAIRRARERTQSKAERLTFVLGSMNQLEIVQDRFDTVIALDTLYFATDLPRTMRAMAGLLRTPGQMGLFWTQMLRDGEDAEQLEPYKTRLAQALHAAGLPYQTYDYTAAEKQHWQRTMDLLEELKPAFEAEGSIELYASRLQETQRILPVIAAGTISRYLYHVQA